MTAGRKAGIIICAVAFAVAAIALALPVTYTAAREVECGSVLAPDSSPILSDECADARHSRAILAGVIFAALFLIGGTLAIISEGDHPVRRDFDGE